MRIMPFGLVALILPQVVAGADLNAPLDEKPTLGSEIKRGWQAAFDCSLAHIVDVQGMNDCTSAAGSKAQQERPNSDPFLLGLYLGSSLHFAAQAERPDPAGGPVPGISDQATNQRNAEEDFAVYASEQKKLGVTDEQAVGTVTDLNDTGRQQALARLKALRGH